MSPVRRFPLTGVFPSARTEGPLRNDRLNKWVKVPFTQVLGGDVSGTDMAPSSARMAAVMKETGKTTCLQE